MTAGGILLTFALVCIGASVIIAVFFRFWPRYGSVEAAIEHSDQLLEAMEPAPDAHEPSPSTVSAAAYVRRRNMA